MKYLLALDQGTSSSRAILYSEQGETVGVAQQELDLILPQDGWVELDPELIWRSIIDVGREVLAQTGVGADQVAAIGITNQRETTLLWERNTHRALYNAIVWQDRRTAAQCEVMASAQIQQMPAAKYIAQTTGLVIDPYFSATKLAWLLDQAPDARSRGAAGELCFGTVDSYLIWRLSGGQAHVTDASNASRTQLFDIHQQQWCQPLLDYFDIPAAVLPQVLDSAGDFAMADPEWFGAAIPITGVAGDQQAALVGQACFTPGMSKSTYGTGCFVMTNTGDAPVESTQQLLTTVAYRLNGQTTFALEGSIFVAGQAIKWLRDELRLIQRPEDTQGAFERTGGDSAGVYVVPGFTGLGAPYWQSDVRALITGMSLDNGRDHVVTAFLQSVAFQTEQLLTAMAKDGAPVSHLRVDGGMVVNNALCQFLADIIELPVERPQDVETTAFGAALLAGVGCGLYDDLAAAAAVWRLDRSFDAALESSRRTQLLDGYAKALRQALTR